MKSLLHKDIELTTQDNVLAETLWIKEIQRSLAMLKFGDRNLAYSLMTMKCTGRLAKAELLKSTKYPILLDKGHHTTSLSVRDSQKRVMHSDEKSTLTKLRARFWIKQGRLFVRKLLYQCVVCAHLKEGLIKLHRHRLS